MRSISDLLWLDLQYEESRNISKNHVMKIECEQVCEKAQNKAATSKFPKRMYKQTMRRLSDINVPSRIFEQLQVRAL